MLKFSEQLEIEFFKVFLNLNKLSGATYMSYTFDKANEIRFSFRSDSIWEAIYDKGEISGKPVMELCPLDKVSREIKNMFIVWDLYCHESQPKMHREIMGMREDLGLRHGLTLSTHFGGHNDAIAVASEDRKNDLAIQILSNENGLLLKQSLLACRQLYFNSLLIPISMA